MDSSGLLKSCFLYIFSIYFGILVDFFHPSLLASWRRTRGSVFEPAEEVLKLADEVVGLGHLACNLPGVGEI